jgi:hypothetical protein
MTRQEVIKYLKSKMDGSVDTSYKWCESMRIAINDIESMDLLSKVAFAADDILKRHNCCYWDDLNRNCRLANKHCPDDDSCEDYA